MRNKKVGLATRVTLLTGPTIQHIINTLAYSAESTQSMPERRCCLSPRAKWSTFSSLKRSPNLIWLGVGGWPDPLSLEQLSFIYTGPWRIISEIFKKIQCVKHTNGLTGNCNVEQERTSCDEHTNLFWFHSLRYPCSYKVNHFLIR